MAFGIQYLNTANLSQQFDFTDHPASGTVNRRGLQLFTYDATALGSDDDEAVVAGAGYFNGANGYLAVGDTILVYTADPAYHILYVTAVAAGVVTIAVAV